MEGTTVRKLLLATTAALGLAASAATANATLTYTIWNGTGLDHSAEPGGVPGGSVPVFASFTSETPIDFTNDSPDDPNGDDNTFGDFFNGIPGNPSPLVSTPGLTAAQLATSMSTTDNTSDVSTLMRITETFSLTTAGTVPLSITHDDGGTIYIDGVFACGNAAESSENTESCTSSLLSAGNHSLAIYYTEDNGAPADLLATIPAEVPEPASLAVLGIGLLGLGFTKLRRRSA